MRGPPSTPATIASITAQPIFSSVPRRMKMAPADAIMLVATSTTDHKSIIVIQPLGVATVQLPLYTPTQPTSGPPTSWSSVDTPTSIIVTKTVVQSRSVINQAVRVPSRPRAPTIGARGEQPHTRKSSQTRERLYREVRMSTAHICYVPAATRSAAIVTPDGRLRKSPLGSEQAAHRSERFKLLGSREFAG